jgi:hypothetical protein
MKGQFIMEKQTMMKRTIALVCSAVMSISSFALPASAEAVLQEKDGKIYCADGETSLTGWQTVDGNLYFFKKSGEAVTRSCSIGGVRYKFTSSGVCKGKYTGWAKSGEKRYYYADGVKVKGWYWNFNLDAEKTFYFDEKTGVLATGKVTVDGREYEFSSDGAWLGTNEISFERCYATLTKRLSKDECGGVFARNGNLVVLSVNGSESVAKYVKKLKDKYAQIVIEDCKFSQNDLEEVSDHIWSHRSEFGIKAMSTDVMNNSIEVIMPKDTKEFTAYLNSLDDKDIVSVVYGDGVVVDD